ncbi:phosphatase [Aureimonas altamirensis]|uniref:Phosphatase n=1 Tax=Aureimonas altamirensis TaxID=370622 RepID=A0A0B1Q9D9_9HYPH|nr:metallophosphoesterase [Aureimonas altamirensis]KHJ55986.1 phosphatase [Aureimonas altamirensis]
MVTRRDLMVGGTLLAASPALAASDGSSHRSPSGGEPLRFGIVADPQYAPVAPNLRSGRYYADSLRKLRQAIGAFNAEDLSFVATLGDIIDRHWDSFGDIMPVYDGLRHEARFVLGNHDFDVAAQYLPSVVAAARMDAPWYDFLKGDTRFIVLDGNDISLFSTPDGSERRALAEERLARLRETGASNAQGWNGSVGEAQMRWLDERLGAADAAGERAIVLCHYPVFPQNDHNLWNSGEIVDLVLSHRSFAVWMNGHNHAGNYGELDKRHFVNFRGMVDTPDTSAYAIVTLQADRMEIAGFGREENRTLKLTAVT